MVKQYVEEENRHTADIADPDHNVGVACMYNGSQLRNSDI